MLSILLMAVPDYWTYETFMFEGLWQLAANSVWKQQETHIMLWGNELYSNTYQRQSWHMHQTSILNKRLSSGVFLSSSADLPTLTLTSDQRTMAGWESLLPPLESSACACVHPPCFSRPLRRKEALSRSISDLSCSSSSTQPGWLEHSAALDSIYI